ncbi:MAG TPA: response regulator [Lachnospiraceae bacterium]|nr:response regulator [Lachnospiraceae bacterium]
MGNTDFLLSILLVDDEPLIREGLTALIDWEAEGYYIAGEASNGRNAIQLLEKNDYDVIISDIKMPEMDGIEFITYLKEKKLSNARIVFLSGFYDFQYAKTAIQYNCCDYILKPIQKEELLTTIRRIADEYQMELGKQKDRTDFEKAYLDRNLLPIIWGKYDYVNVKNIQEKLYLSEEISYIHVELSLKDERFHALSEEKRREQQRKLNQYASLLMKKHANYIIFDAVKYAECYNIGVIYCTFFGNEKGMTKEEWVSWLVHELEERISYRIVASAGGNVNRIDDISDSYMEATMTRFFYFNKKDATIGNMFGKKECQVNSILDGYLKKEIDNLIHAIEVCDSNQIAEFSNNLYDSIVDKRADMKAVDLNLQYFIYQVMGLAYELEANINQDEIVQCIWDAISLNGKEQGSRLKLKKFAQEFSDYLKQLRQKSTKGVINQVEAYIEVNYADEISLKSIGEKFFVNSAYLGQLFKKQYGCSFKEYLNNLRIRKAAELMLNTDKKVYEIAEDVGYKNLEYFINKFEGKYGATPKRFRKSKVNALPISNDNLQNDIDFASID